MAPPVFDNFKRKAQIFWENLIKKSNEDEIADMGRERIVVFVVAFILAICLWFMVNLSRDYTLNIDFPIQKGAVPDKQALAKKLPENINVSVSGEGWKLISLYNNPPTVNVDLMSSDINLYELVQRQMNVLSDINVQKVQPLMITPNLEQRASKRVPVKPVLDVSFKGQYGFIGNPKLKPDSITISGAASLIQNIIEWPTDSLSMSTVSSDISRIVPLKMDELITLSQNQVQFTGKVAQFTEGETSVMLHTRNLPVGQNISYNPSSITVKFDVPINKYAAVEDKKLFEAYLTYQQIKEDSTGYVTPYIDQLYNNENIKIRSFHPRKVAYFMVVGN